MLDLRRHSDDYSIGGPPLSTLSFAERIPLSVDDGIESSLTSILGSSGDGDWEKHGGLS